MGKKLLITGVLALLILPLAACGKATTETSADEQESSKVQDDDDSTNESDDTDKDESDDSNDDSSDKDDSGKDTDSTDNEDTDSSKSTSSKISNESVDLSEFAENPEDYVGKNIKTTGSVIYIQKKPSDENMYYVVIAPKDSHTTSGYSEGHGTVVEVNVDIMEETPIHEGDTITVNGGGLTQMVQLNGKTLKSSIIADSVEQG